MRLGGPVSNCESPDQWAAEHLAAGYNAAYWPNPPVEMEEAFLHAAGAAGLVIAEVGAWSNPLSPDPAEREKARRRCIEQLATADRVGARCCVNIAGSLGAQWAGPAADDLTERAFEQIVHTTQEIIDAVKPTRTYYSLETMPWMYPDSTESYLQLIEAIDRERFAVHFDPVNLINSPARYFHNGAVIREAVAAFGHRIRSCHAKDVLMDTKFIVHLDEVAPGNGTLDYGAFLHALEALDPDTPLMLEHLEMEEYPRAAQYIRSVAEREGIRL
ncbi:MAG: sugar phosphate isomerase/epimerase family protein [Armatimonadota bacterium]